MIFDSIDIKFCKIATLIEELFSKNKILGEDFHKREYFKDDILDDEVENMTKTLYYSLVEERGIEKGVEKTTISFLDLLDDEVIANKTGLSLIRIKDFRRQKEKREN